MPLKRGVYIVDSNGWLPSIYAYGSSAIRRFMQFIPRVSSSTGMDGMFFAKCFPRLPPLTQLGLPALQWLNGHAHATLVRQVELLVEP